MLGNQWLLKTYGNRNKRAKYTSQVMRLAARLLLNLHNLMPLKENNLWNYLVPDHFDLVVKSTLQTAVPGLDDERLLEKPSNAIKLGFDIKHMVNIKVGLAIQENDKLARKEGQDLLAVMDIFWETNVTKLARSALQDRRINKQTMLPKASDIEKLNKHLKEKFANLDLVKTSSENFAKVAETILTKLLVYNRRRSGDMESVRLVKDLCHHLN
jgi:hypothetical protein